MEDNDKRLLDASSGSFYKIVETEEDFHEYDSVNLRVVTPCGRVIVDITYFVFSSENQLPSCSFFTLSAIL